MFEKLENMRKRFYELNGLIADPAVMQRREEWQNLVKEHAALEPVVEAYERYLKATEEMEACGSGVLRTARRNGKTYRGA